MVITVRTDQIHSDGDGVPDDAYLEIRRGALVNYIFRAGEVYSLRNGEINRLTKAYRIGKRCYSTSNLRLLTAKDTLAKLTKKILEDHERTRSFSTRKLPVGIGRL